MSFAGRPRGEGRDSYHHGNLREALVAAALALIAERGLSGFAFAELARAAGVSAAAPYRHVRDRNAVRSLTHGIATLFVGGPQGGPWQMPMAAEELLEAGLLIYFGSLGLAVPHTAT